MPKFIIYCDTSQMYEVVVEAKNVEEAIKSYPNIDGGYFQEVGDSGWDLYEVVEFDEDEHNIKEFNVVDTKGELLNEDKVPVERHSFKDFIPQKESGR
jgi:hypothetical protein